MNDAKPIGYEKAFGVTVFPEDDPTNYSQYITQYGSVMVDIAKEVVDASCACIESARDSSVRKHVRFISADTEKPRADAPGMAGFELTFDEPGKYLVWVRYIAMQDASASVWLDYAFFVSPG